MGFAGPFDGQCSIVTIHGGAWACICLTTNRLYKQFYTKVNLNFKAKNSGTCKSEYKTAKKLECVFKKSKKVVRIYLKFVYIREKGVRG